MKRDPERILLYAIRLKGTDKYLPANQMGGFTFDEPTSIEVKPPRFFFIEKSAKGALAQWCRGIHTKHRSGGYRYGGFGSDDYEEYIEVVPQPGRKREDMEIVTFKAEEDTNG